MPLAQARLFRRTELALKSVLQKPLAQAKLSRSNCCTELVIKSVIQKPLAQARLSRSNFCTELVLKSVLQTPLRAGSPGAISVLNLH